MNITDDNINEVIYSLGNQYQLYPNKWSMVGDKLSDEYEIELSNDAIRKRYKRFKRTVNRQQNNLSDMSKSELVSLAETLLVERANRAAANEIKLKPHYPDYDFEVSFEAKNVLLISDLHLPFATDGWLNFILRTRDKYDCETVVSGGDILDQHVLGRWVTDPDGYSGGHEIEEAVKEVQKLYKEIPDMRVCLGNHDTRHMAAAMKAQLSVRYLRHLNEILDIDWEWHYTFEQITEDVPVLYTHGEEKGGKFATQNISMSECRSVASVHTHTTPGVNWYRNHWRTWFALNGGCLLDQTSYALKYGKKNAYKLILGCGVILRNGNDPRFIRYDP